jgi:hypothetical protein
MNDITQSVFVSVIRNVLSGSEAIAFFEDQKLKVQCSWSQEVPGRADTVHLQRTIVFARELTDDFPNEDHYTQDQVLIRLADHLRTALDQLTKVLARAPHAVPNDAEWFIGSKLLR